MMTARTSVPIPPHRLKLVAWILWGAFIISLGMLGFLGFKVLQPPEVAQPMPVNLLLGIAGFEAIAALALRAFRARAKSDSTRQTMMILGLAVGESIAIMGLILRMTGAAPHLFLPLLLAAAALHAIQAPHDFGKSDDPHGGPDLESGIPKTTIQ